MRCLDSDNVFSDLIIAKPGDRLPWSFPTCIFKTDCTSMYTLFIKHLT